MYDYPFGLQQLIESIAKCILNAEEKDNEKRISSEKALQVIKSVSYKHNHTLSIWLAPNTRQVVLDNSINFQVYIAKCTVIGNTSGESCLAVVSLPILPYLFFYVCAMTSKKSCSNNFLSSSSSINNLFSSSSSRK